MNLLTETIVLLLGVVIILPLFLDVEEPVAKIFFLIYVIIFISLFNVHAVLLGLSILVTIFLLITYNQKQKTDR